MSEWKMVPVAPTEAMVASGIKRRNIGGGVRDIWELMLAAAPQQDDAKACTDFNLFTSPPDDGIKWLIEKLHFAGQGVATIPPPEILMLAAAKELARLAAAPQPDDELARLERELATFYVTKAIQTAQAWNESGWLDTSCGAYVNLVRYLDLRGLLERHPDNSDLVKVRE